MGTRNDYIELTEEHQIRAMVDGRNGKEFIVEHSELQLKGWPQELVYEGVEFKIKKVNRDERENELMSVVYDSGEMTIEVFND